MERKNMKRMKLSGVEVDVVWSKLHNWCALAEAGGQHGRHHPCHHRDEEETLRMMMIVMMTMTPMAMIMTIMKANLQHHHCHSLKDETNHNDMSE